MGQSLLVGRLVRGVGIVLVGLCCGFVCLFGSSVLSIVSSLRPFLVGCCEDGACRVCSAGARAGHAGLCVDVRVSVFVQRQILKSE